MRSKGRSRKFFNISLTITTVMATLIGMWWFVIGAKSTKYLTSDSHRLEAARCWLSAMFTGSNRFLYGVGFNNEKLNSLCIYIRGEGRSMGHAHNTFAQIGGHHGLLGIIALSILLIVVVQGLVR